MHCTNALCLQLENMHPQADDATVSRHLEAYLLWLFGWTMFTSTHGNTVDRTLIRFAREIADSDPHAVPQYSWYGPFAEDAPTMGTLWCRRRVSTLYLMFIDSTVSHL